MESFGLFRRGLKFLSFSARSKTFNALVLLLIVAAVPLTVFVAQQRQETRQRAAESDFFCDANGFDKKGCGNRQQNDICGDDGHTGGTWKVMGGGCFSDESKCIGNENANDECAQKDGKDSNDGDYWCYGFSKNPRSGNIPPDNGDNRCLHFERTTGSEDDTTPPVNNCTQDPSICNQNTQQCVNGVCVLKIENPQCEEKVVESCIRNQCENGEKVCIDKWQKTDCNTEDRRRVTIEACGIGGTGPGFCTDDPTGSNTPQDYKWKATCGDSLPSCYVTGNNSDPRYNDKCGQNNFDPLNVDPKTSNWCYGFSGKTGTNADWRCLQLVRPPCEKSGDQGCSRKTPVCQSATSLQPRFKLKSSDGWGNGSLTISLGQTVIAGIIKNQTSFASSQDTTAKIEGPDGFSRPITDVTKENQFKPDKAGRYTLKANCGSIKEEGFLNVNVLQIRSDLNKDTRLNGLDYGILRDKVKAKDFSGCPGKPSSSTRCADLNNDGNLDVGDLNIWLIDFDLYGI